MTAGSVPHAPGPSGSASLGKLGGWLRHVPSRSGPRDALIAGFFGPLGGWAVFIFWLAEAHHLSTLVLALAASAIVAIALEHLREVIREGHGELERHGIGLIAVAIVSLVLTCELFAHAFSKLVEARDVLPSVVGVLAGPTGDAKLSAWWGVGGLLGIWSYMGMAASQWIVGIADVVGDESSGGTPKRCLHGVVRGAIASLMSALAALTGLFAFRLVVALTSESAKDAMLAQITQPYVPNQVVAIVDLLLKGWHWALHWLGEWARHSSGGPRGPVDPDARVANDAGVAGRGISPVRRAWLRTSKRCLMPVARWTKSWRGCPPGWRCVGASFGFWVTLACLASRADRPRH